MMLLVGAILQLECILQDMDKPTKPNSVIQFFKKRYGFD